MKTLRFALAVCLVSVCAYAEVMRVEVTSRKDIPQYGYEQIIGKVHFAVDPKEPRNNVIADIDKAPSRTPTAASSSRRYPLRPRPKTATATASRWWTSSTAATRRRFALNRASRRRKSNRRRLPDEAGLHDRLHRLGVRRRARATAPCASTCPWRPTTAAPITGIVRGAFTPDRRDINFTVTDTAAYAPVDVNDADATLTVRDGLSATVQTIPRSEWKMAR